MIYQDVQGVIKRILPGPVARAIRAAATALLSPLHWSYQSGHFRSSLISRAVDKSGRPLPWYTYPAIHFLSAKNLSERDILEFGAGQSTLWWAERARSVIALENDSGWLEALKRKVPSNVSLYPVLTGLDDAEPLLQGKEFDVIIVDGLDRLAAAKEAVAHLKDAGAILLDNAECFWGEPGTYPILDLFRKEGFRRIDFYGHAPGVILPHCTSLLFRSECFLLSGEENPVQPNE